MRACAVAVPGRDSARLGWLPQRSLVSLNTKRAAFYPRQGPQRAALPSLEVQLPGPFLPPTPLGAKSWLAGVVGGLKVPSNFIKINLVKRTPPNGLSTK